MCGLIIDDNSYGLMLALNYIEGFGHMPYLNHMLGSRLNEECEDNQVMRKVLFNE